MFSRGFLSFKSVKHLSAPFTVCTCQCILYINLFVFGENRNQFWTKKIFSREYFFHVTGWKMLTNCPDLLSFKHLIFCDKSISKYLMYTYTLDKQWQPIPENKKSFFPLQNSWAYLNSQVKAINFLLQKFDYENELR